MGMTNEQSHEYGLLCRLYELDRMENLIDDPEALEVIKAQKKELMNELETLHKHHR